MDITILGARANIKVEAGSYRRHAGVLIDNTLLFDLGEKEYLRYKPSVIFITHFHPDHAFFMTHPTHLGAKVYGPSDDYGAHALHSPVIVNGYRVTPVPTEHSALLASQGYLIEKAGKKVFYTGDIAWIKESELAKLPHLDAVIAEASLIQAGGMVRLHAGTGKLYGHTGIPDIIEMFTGITDIIIFMHFGSWFVRDPDLGLQQLQRLERPSLRVIAARDGMYLRL